MIVHTSIVIVIRTNMSSIPTLQSNRAASPLSPPAKTPRRITVTPDTYHRHHLQHHQQSRHIRQHHLQQQQHHQHHQNHHLTMCFFFLFHEPSQHGTLTSVFPPGSCFRRHAIASAIQGASPAVHSKPENLNITLNPKP